MAPVNHGEARCLVEVAALDFARSRWPRDELLDATPTPENEKGSANAEVMLTSPSCIQVTSYRLIEYKLP